MTHSIYNLGVQYFLQGGAILALVVFMVYLVSICVSYVNGKDITLFNFVGDNIYDPTKNTDLGLVVTLPLMILSGSLFGAFIWFIVIPGAIIFLILRRMRARNFSKQKMWNTLKGEQ